MANTKVKAEQLEAAQTNITSLGTLTALTVDDITIDGSTISDGGDLTIDVAGDIILDADGGDIILRDGGTNFAHLSNSSNNLLIRSAINNADIVFRGYDGGSEITSLTLDMSDAGAATFNSTVTAVKLVSTNGVIELDDNGSHNGVINVPASLFINIDSDGNSAGEDFIIGKDRTATSGGTELFRIDEGGNVGIGTSDPKRMLQVGDNTQAIAALSLQTTTSGLSRIYMGDNDGTSAEYTGMISYAHSDDSMQFFTSSTERMRIHSDGKVDVKNSGTDKVARFINTGSGTQGITVGTTTADNAGKGIHLSHDNSSTAYVHAYNYAGASFDNLELRGNTVSTVGGTGHNVFRACANGLFSIGSATYTQGRIRQYVYTASISNGVEVDLFYNGGAYDDLHLLITVEATHSGRTYRTRVGPFVYYQSLPTLSAGVGLDFTQETVNTGRRRIKFNNTSGYTAATYISALIFGDNSVVVENGAISDLL